MAPSTPLVALILRYDKGVGSAVAQKLKSEGFSVAVSGRSIDTTEFKNEGDLIDKADFSNAEAITGIFDQVEWELGPAAFRTL
ncbi:hypothetical protein FRC03_002072 [Tulasnella sp. 419]|nr:hypothetical protein FRC03_002072 [Tulasnella sp. 419]